MHQSAILPTRTTYPHNTLAAGTPPHRLQPSDQTLSWHAVLGSPWHHPHGSPILIDGPTLSCSCPGPHLITKRVSSHPMSACRPHLGRAHTTCHIPRAPDNTTIHHHVGLQIIPTRTSCPRVSLACGKTPRLPLDMALPHQGTRPPGMALVCKTISTEHSVLLGPGQAFLSLQGLIAQQSTTLLTPPHC
jgi:hypothetical protein